MKYLHTDHYTV